MSELIGDATFLVAVVFIVWFFRDIVADFIVLMGGNEDENGNP